VRVINKIFAAIVMGLVGWFVIGFPIMLMVVPSLSADPHPSVGWTFLGPGIAVVATIAVTVVAPTGRIAWGHLCLLNGLLSLGLLPLAGTVFSVLRASRFAACCVRCRQSGRENRCRARRHDAGVRGFLFGRDFPSARVCHLAERNAPLIANSRGMIVRRRDPARRCRAVPAAEGRKACDQQVEPDAGEMAERCGADMAVPEWPAARLLPVRQPQCRHGGDRDRAALALTAPPIQISQLTALDP
jgi:hypothetical protein